MKRKTTLRALLMSVLSLVLCCSMLIGSTFAWFTDSASTGVNKIVAGNLDIELSYKNAKTGATYTKVTGETKDLFVDATGADLLWEPGKVAVCYFKLENVGSLDLEYKMKVSYKDTVTYNNDAVKLSDALKSAVVDFGTTETAFADRTDALTKAETAGVAALGYNTEKVKIESGTTKYFAMVVWMPESVNNTYNLPTDARPLEIQLGIDLIATQVESENDSFGNDYDQFADTDVSANLPERNYVAEVLPYTSEAIDKENVKENWRVQIPAGAIVPAASNPNPTNVVLILNSLGNNTWHFELQDEKANVLTLNSPATITVRLGIGLEDVAFNGTPASYTDNGYATFKAQAAGDYAATFKYANAVNVGTAEEFVEALTTGFGNGDTIALTSDIDMKDVAWPGMDLTNASATILGNGHTVSNLTSTNRGGLVNQIQFGNTLIVKNLVLDNLTVNSTDAYVGGIVGYVGEAKEVTIENVTIQNSKITGSDRVGGFIGWNSGWNDENDGAVYAGFTVKDCKLIRSVITGVGSTAGAVGHAGGNPYTVNTVDNVKVSESTFVNTEGAAKVGLLVATANMGSVVIKNCEAADFSGNTILSVENNNTIVGRFSPAGTGSLTVNTVDQGTAYKENITIA